MLDLVIAHGTIVTAEGCARADLGIREGRIAALGEGLVGHESIDATGMLVLPGGVDEHVHLQMPAGDVVSSDDFFTGTVAAAFGGTTTIVDFAEPHLGEPLVRALTARRAEADGKATIDYALHMTLSSASHEMLAQIPACIEAGAASFKLYMAYEGLRLDDGGLLAALEALCAHGGRALVHAENHHAIAYLVARALESGKTGPENHPDTRPALLEAEAVHRLLALAWLNDTPVTVAHLSCGAGLDEVRKARARGQAVWVETCPQYLLLDESEYRRRGFEGAKYVMSPPLRGQADRAALWSGVQAREVNTVATDHCPFLYAAQKIRGKADFSRIPGGAPGIETRLMLLFEHGVRRGRLTPERWVELCCTEPARQFGLAPRKGTLAVGADADVVIWNPDRRATLSCKTLHQNVDYCPYEGWAVQGLPVTVLSRGETIVHEGEFLGAAGRGRFLRTNRRQARAEGDVRAPAPATD